MIPDHLAEAAGHIAREKKALVEKRLALVAGIARAKISIAEMEGAIIDLDRRIENHDKSIEHLKGGTGAVSLGNRLRQFFRRAPVATAMPIPDPTLDIPEIPREQLPYVEVKLSEEQQQAITPRELALVRKRANDARSA